MDENIMELLMIGCVMLVCLFATIHEGFRDRSVVCEDDEYCECCDPPHYRDPCKVKHHIKDHSLFKDKDDSE